MRHLALLLAVQLSFGASACALAAEPPKRPNVLLILADDLGYGDVQCYNPKRGKIPTPHIDRLASQGMRFTDAHSSSACCSPSRYALLTGRYHWRTRLQSGIVQYLERPLIAPEQLTIAGMLKQQGYHTACIGKWHLGWDWDIPPSERKLFAPGRRTFPDTTDRHRQAWQARFSRPIAGGPTTRGFDVYFGTDVPNWPPYCFIDNDRTIGIPTEFLPAALFENNLASTSGPALADWKLEAILPAMTERACDYIGQRAKSGQPFFLYFPLTSPHTPLAVNEPWRGKSGLDSAVADLIMETDDAVGRVLAAVAQSGAQENTLVIFTSDNGFASYVGVKHLEERGHYPSGPLRGYKADAWEGGHRVAFIARWPGVVEPRSVCDQLVHQADVMSTLAQIVGVTLPDDAGVDSFSLLPLLQGGKGPMREHAVSQSALGLFALRRGDWKLLFGPGGGGGSSQLSATAPDGHPAQLYNLADDLGETKNRYGERPEIAGELTGLLQHLISAGRSTPGPLQKNDVEIQWRRFMKPEGVGDGQ
ncbi:MAG: arylsulfatase [Pirellulales bacterium]